MNSAQKTLAIRLLVIANGLLTGACIALALILAQR